MDSNTTPSESQEIPVESEASDTVKLSSSTDTSPIQSLPYGGNYPQHETYGKGIGVMQGRVVWSHNPGSVQWDGSDYWWETSHFDEAVILQMVNDSIASLGGRDTAKDGWNALFATNNNTCSRYSGYTRGENRNQGKHQWFGGI